jgi:hypothetical protein
MDNLDILSNDPQEDSIIVNQNEAYSNFKKVTMSSQTEQFKSYKTSTADNEVKL